MSDSSSVTPVAGDLAFTRDDLRGTIPEAAYAGALSFMRRRFTRDLTNADVAILGVPYDLALSGRSGTRFGPRGVRTASANIAWSGPWPWETDPYEQLAIVDYGDCEFDPGKPADIPGTIAATARKILATETALLSIGGDHFITYPLLQAHAEKHGPLHVIQFDAHTDTWADEPDRIDHGTMLWHGVREGLVVPERSVQVGIRTHNPDPLGFNVISSREVHQQGPAEIARRIREIVGDGPCYLTFDIDALDPSAAPGTGTPVIGGLTTYQAQEMLYGLAGIDLRGMDLVEVSPPYDVSEITALAAATLISDMLAVYAARPGA
ncbi:agmatinase [Tropicimonas isoalkanivorans]|uniref:Agmatinase n=1 Tax=Tropicimonas isoalkanivorans TaxID=441112 RepID=A0A1I1PJA8_9RHOB|nr:agmatinase [Tropicimonas isoalkanivorans]SFD09904.1 agmatinase [Tropicimonas isoalkanivorans]